MFSLFKQPKVYVKIYRDRMEITNLDTGDVLSRTGKFSAQRNVVSDFGNAELLIRSMIKEMRISNSFISRSLKILMHQLEGAEGGLNDIEKRALRDLAEQAGASFVAICWEPRTYSNHEAAATLENDYYKK